MWDAETKTTIGALVVELRVSGTIAVSEKQTFVNYFDVPVVKPEESPDDGSSFWLSNDLENLVIQTLSDFVSDQKHTMTESFGNYTDYTAKWYPNALVDNTEYYVNSIVFLSSVNDIPADLNSKVYLRFNIDSDIQPAVMYLGEENNLLFLYCSKEHIVSSIGSFWTLDAGLQFSVVYLFSETMGKSSEIMISEPVCVVIDDYADFWAKQGLETEEEIRAYLDSLPYESFVAPEMESQTLTVPENLLADIVYDGEVESSGEVPENTKYLIAGTRENINVDYEVRQEELITLPTDAFQIITTLPDGTYYQTGYNQMLFADFATLQSQSGSVGDTFVSHKCYIAYDYEAQGSMDGAFQLFNLNPGAADETFYLLCTYENNTENQRISSIIGPVDGVKGFASFNLGFMCPENNITAPPSSFVLNHPIVVDITANQSFFDALGLSTDEEIKTYLDTVAFEDFGVATVTV